MINLIKEGTSNTIAISPATASIYHDLVSGSFRLNITQDYDMSSASLALGKLAPVPAGYYNNYLLFSVPSGLIPSQSGNYSYVLVEGITGTGIWGNTTETFGLADFKWTDEGTFINDRPIDSGRVRVVGLDNPSYLSYTGGPQDGQYTTYNR